MTAIHETAYPRIRSNLSDQELKELYTPTPDDLVFIERSTKSMIAAFGAMVLLKTFQRLGYFPAFDALPPRLMRHLANTMGMLLPQDALEQYEQRRLREAHIPQIRDHLVAYPLAAENVSGPLPYRLNDTNQPVIRSPDRFSGPYTRLLACI
jgi:hypothetical protein